MNDLQRAAMQMAYETLERLSCVKQTMHLLWWQIEARKPLSVLREALAQPIVKESLTAQKQGEWVDLTDDEIKTAYESWWETHDNHAFPIWVGAKAAIAKFKSKNTPPVVPQGEPVALLQLAEDALVYHTEQTRPIQNTIDALAAIQKFKEKQR